MGDVYAVSSAKGGVGKTTTAVNLAATLAAAGHDVVAIDGDLATPNFGASMGVEASRAAVHEALAGQATLPEATYEGPHGMRVVPGRDELDAFRAADPGALGDVIREFDEAEYVIVDTSAGLTHGSALPLSVADGTLLVSTPDRDALAATRKTAILARELGGSVAGIALNRAEPDDEAVGVDAPVLGWIPDSELIADACAAAEPLTTFAPASGEATAYRRLASRLTVARVPPPPGTDASAADERTADGVTTRGPADTSDATLDPGDTSDLDEVLGRDTDASPPASSEQPTAGEEGAIPDDTGIADDPLAADDPSGEPEPTAQTPPDEQPDPSMPVEEAASPPDAPESDSPDASTGPPDASTDPTAGPDEEADDPTVLSRGEEEGDMIVAAGSEVEAAKEAKTVLGEPVPDEAISRTETERGDAVEYEIDRDAIPFGDDDPDEPDDEQTSGGFLSWLFRS